MANSRASSWRFCFVVVFPKKKELRLTSTETVRLIRDREKGGGGGGMEVGAEGDYIPIATLSPPE